MGHITIIASFACDVKTWISNETPFHGLRDSHFVCTRVARVPAIRDWRIMISVKCKPNASQTDTIMTVYRLHSFIEIIFQRGPLLCAASHPTIPATASMVFAARIDVHKIIRTTMKSFQFQAFWQPAILIEGFSSVCRPWTETRKCRDKQYTLCHGPQRTRTIHSIRLLWDARVLDAHEHSNSTSITALSRPAMQRHPNKSWLHFNMHFISQSNRLRLRYYSIY